MAVQWFNDKTELSFNLNSMIFSFGCGHTYTADKLVSFEKCSLQPKLHSVDSFCVIDDSTSTSENSQISLILV